MAPKSATPLIPKEGMSGARGVRDYLVSQSVQDGNITSKGFGKNSPVADNAGAAGLRFGGWAARAEAEGKGG